VQQQALEHARVPAHEPASGAARLMQVRESAFDLLTTLPQ
jgi:hypothetical protein